MLTHDEARSLPIGQLLLTPYEPRGIVALLKVTKDGTALVRFTHDHRGFKRGSGGKYRLSELSIYEDPEPAPGVCKPACSHCGQVVGSGAGCEYCAAVTPTCTP